MAYRFLIDPSVNCVFIQHFGTYEPSEGHRQVEELLKDPAYRKDMYMMRDTTQVSLPDSYDLNWFKNKVREKLSDTDDKLGPRRKVAWVLGNAHDFMILHQWCTVGRLNNKVDDRQPFRDVSKAMKWLGLPHDYEISYP